MEPLGGEKLSKLKREENVTQCKDDEKRKQREDTKFTPHNQREADLEKKQSKQNNKALNIEDTLYCSSGPQGLCHREIKTKVLEKRGFGPQTHTS